MQDSILDFWLDNVKEEYRGELQNMKQDKNLFDECFCSELQFGTGGLRGIVGMGTNRMNIYTVGRVSRGLAAYMYDHGMKRIAISYDSRKMSRLFAETAACVFAKNGIKVIIVQELMPTPFLSFLIRTDACDMGVMITASHNPAAYNGYKVYNNESCQITDNTAREIACCIQKESYFEDNILTFNHYLQADAIQFVDEVVEEKYLQGIYNIVGKTDFSDIKVAYTALNGTGYRIMPKLLRGAGVNIVLTEQQCIPDESFATCPYPNPEKEKALLLGIQTAKASGCDLLIATDPDADRIGIVVRHGKEYVILTGNEVGLIFTKYLLQ